MDGAWESVPARAMTATVDALPDDIGTLHTLLLAERAERAQFAERIAILERLNTKLEHIVAPGRGSVAPAATRRLIICRTKRW